MWLKETPTWKKNKSLTQPGFIRICPVSVEHGNLAKTFSLLLSVKVEQTGWMETQTRTMSHTHAVDFTVGMCIPAPTKESFSTHTDTLKHRPQRHRGPLLVFTDLRRKKIEEEKNRGVLSVLLKYWNYSTPNSWTGVFAKTDPSN